MTVKAEVVLALLISGIELMREREPQNESIIRTVRVVAGAAITLNDRPVLEASLLPDLFILVTLKTELINLILQQILVARIMG